MLIMLISSHVRFMKDIPRTRAKRSASNSMVVGGVGGIMIIWNNSAADRATPLAPIDNARAS